MIVVPRFSIRHGKRLSRLGYHLGWICISEHTTTHTEILHITMHFDNVWKMHVVVATYLFPNKQKPAQNKGVLCHAFRECAANPHCACFLHDGRVGVMSFCVMYPKLAKHMFAVSLETCKCKCSLQ